MYLQSQIWKVYFNNNMNVKFLTRNPDNSGKHNISKKNQAIQITILSWEAKRQ